MSVNSSKFNFVFYSHFEIFNPAINSDQGSVQMPILMLAKLAKVVAMTQRDKLCVVHHKMS